MSLVSNLKICHINIEEISNSKSEYLAHLMHDEDIVTVQETHAGSEKNLRRRETISGYTLIGAVYSNVHGIATYVKASFSNCRVLYQDHSHDVHILAVEVDRTIVVNVETFCSNYVLIQLFMLTISIHITNFGVMNTTMLTEINS
jgi:exonuclease III